MSKILVTIVCAFFFCVNAIALSNSTSLPSFLIKEKAATKLSTAKKKKTFSVDVWSIIEVDQKINTPIFFPYNDQIPGYDYSNYNFGKNQIKSELFDTHKNAIKWNLWTILMRNFFKGELTLYSPFDPNWEMNRDNGFLLYPILPAIPDGTFETDSVFRENVFIHLGHELIDPFAPPLKSWLYPGEDSLIQDPSTGMWEAVYPPSDHIWYQDSDIIGYKIKEKWFLDKNGNVRHKKISAIAPMIMMKDWNGNDIGERELFWIDYGALEELLKPYYIKLDRYKKDQIISLYDFFDKREFYASKIDTKVLSD